MKNIIFIAIVCCIIGGVDGQTLLTGKNLNNAGKMVFNTSSAQHSCNR